ncbi:hypothetical protein KAW48_01435 [candidate division WOR-3 bacterium]|nr:hypothetical protein [candidate division WOR-3 bacterium]
MKDSWKVNPIHIKLLEKLFSDVDIVSVANILDAGSGRTSLTFLTDFFPKSNITALVYPGDERKKSGIAESVTADNFVLKETDLHDFDTTRQFDVVLAHLLLGEATKFSKESFGKMLNALFGIDTSYLAVVDILEDPQVNYRALLRSIAQHRIQKIIYLDKYIGFLVKK